MSIFMPICGLALASSCKYSRIKYCDLLPSCESYRERLIRMVVMVIMRNMIVHNLNLFILMGICYHLLICHTHIYVQICSLDKNFVFPFPFVLARGPQKTKPEIKQYAQDFIGEICSTRGTKHGKR